MTAKRWVVLGERRESVWVEVNAADEDEAREAASRERAANWESFGDDPSFIVDHIEDAEEYEARELAQTEAADAAREGGERQ